MYFWYYALSMHVIRKGSFAYCTKEDIKSDHSFMRINTSMMMIVLWSIYDNQSTDDID